jgi:hypothetical protein
MRESIPDENLIGPEAGESDEAPRRFNAQEIYEETGTLIETFRRNQLGANAFAEPRGGRGTSDVANGLVQSNASLVFEQAELLDEDGTLTATREELREALSALLSISMDGHIDFHAMKERFLDTPQARKLRSRRNRRVA